MKLNHITCTNYEAGEIFLATLQDTSREEIMAITPDELVVQADDGSVVETFTFYSKLYSVKHTLETDRYDVEFRMLSEAEEIAKQALEAVSELEAKVKYIARMANVDLDTVSSEEELEGSR